MKNMNWRLSLVCLASGLVWGASPFAGRWDVTLKSPSGEYPSWIEFSEQDGKLAAQMTGRWGNARPLPKLEVRDFEIEFVSPKREEGGKEDMVFHGAFAGGRIAGSVNGPDGTQWSWTAVHAPSLERQSSPEWGEPVPLFNGHDMAEWRIRDTTGPNGWKVEAGALTNHPRSTDLVTNRQFGDFKLHVEFNCPPGCNSGVYLRGRYEVQIEDDSIKEPPSHHTGGVYGFIAPSPELPRRPGEWQSFDITLVGRRVTVVQNGKTIIENCEIPGLTGGAIDSHEELPGPILLQGDHGSLSFRNIIVTPAK
jgi:hypothetical protein